MHHIFGGPFHDQTTRNALREIQNPPGLVVDIEEQKKRYTKKFTDILQQSGYMVLRANPLVASLSFDGTHISVSDLLYPPPQVSELKGDWTNKITRKRVPYFSGFRIGG